MSENEKKRKGKNSKNKADGKIQSLWDQTSNVRARVQLTVKKGYPGGYVKLLAELGGVSHAFLQVRLGLSESDGSVRHKD